MGEQLVVPSYQSKDLDQKDHKSAKEVRLSFMNETILFETKLNFSKSLRFKQSNNSEPLVS